MSLSTSRRKRNLSENYISKTEMAPTDEVGIIMTEMFTSSVCLEPCEVFWVARRWREQAH
jgi:hypothetical protein